jgi:beta-ketodecanoyl-[acyl-carrier-protein] synthase
VLLNTRDVFITGSGVFHPDQELTNEELVSSYNGYLQGVGGQTADAASRPYLDGSPIAKASGILRRRVVDKHGILDITRMRPRLGRRPAAALSLQAEMAAAASRQALQAAQLEGPELDLVIVGATSLERAYPAIAIELQQELGAGDGYAYDISAACSSATFAIGAACDAIAAGHAGCVLVAIPELATAQVDFRDRQSHFIFGDGAAAVVLQAAPKRRGQAPFRILGQRLSTKFSNSIRNDFGFLAPCSDEDADRPRLAFSQNGVKVMRDVVPMASQHILSHLDVLGIHPGEVDRAWLHQANEKINRLVCQKAFGASFDEMRAPNILADYGNLAAAGALAAFHHHHSDLELGAVGVLCSFGAGYTVGSIVMERG